MAFSEKVERDALDILQRNNQPLRIPAIHGAKTTKNHTPLVCFPRLFYNQTVFQKFERPFFDQVAIDAKDVLTFEKCPLVAELKLKT